MMMGHDDYTDSDECSRWTAAPLEERRQSQRFPKEPGMDFAVICEPQRLTMQVEIHDESLGGIAVIVDDGEIFPVGQEVVIQYADERLRGIVRHVQPQDDGRFAVGFQCERLSDWHDLFDE